MIPLAQSNAWLIEPALPRLIDVGRSKAQFSRFVIDEECSSRPERVDQRQDDDAERPECEEPVEEPVPSIGGRGLDLSA